MTAATITQESIDFIDLKAQRKYLGARIDDAIARVLSHGQYVLGPEVSHLEEKLADYVGCEHAITCANGTDALQLVLMAQGVGPGDAVFVPSFTFTSTAEVVSLVGASPVFVDVHAESFNMDSESLSAAVQAVKLAGKLKAKAVISVDLFGRPADYPTIEKVCTEHGLWLMVDAAQSFGATFDGKQSCNFGIAATTSFFPAKPLGCYGDGGAIFTNDSSLAQVLLSLRVHGQGSDKYNNVRVGLNSRLDAIQAAILQEKLAIFPEEILKRESAAQAYMEGLRDVVEVPSACQGSQSVWAQFTVKHANRDKLATSLRQQGVPSAIYYPKPLHQQIAYSGCQLPPNGLPVCDALAKQVLSLPMHPYLEPAVQNRIIAAVQTAAKS